MNEPIDVIISSYKRWDLLRKTLDSFFEFNTYPINQVYVYEDFGADNFSKQDDIDFTSIANEYEGIVAFILNGKRIGQIKSIDNLVSRFVKTEYYFSIEDDWQFTKSGFIEKSFEYLEKDSNILQVWLRGKRDTNNHPIVVKNGLLALQYNYKGIWHGFSFNPGLRRLSDYKKIGSYSQHATFDPKNPSSSEAKIGKLYKDMGMFAITTHESYVKHIGDERGIRS